MGPGLGVPPETRCHLSHHFKWKRLTLSPEGEQRPGSEPQCPEPRGIPAAARQVAGTSSWPHAAVAGISGTGAWVAGAVAAVNRSSVPVHPDQHRQLEQLPFHTAECLG